MKKKINSELITEPNTIANTVNNSATSTTNANTNTNTSNKPKLKPKVKNNFLPIQAAKESDDKFIKDLFSKIDSLDSQINWETNSPKSIIKKFYIFSTHNWTEILNIIKIIIKMVKHERDRRELRKSSN